MRICRSRMNERGYEHADRFHCKCYTPEIHQIGQLKLVSTNSKNQNLDLNLYREIPRNLTSSFWWTLGMFNVAFLVQPVTGDCSNVSGHAYERVLHSIAVCCSVLQCEAVYCSVLHCVAVGCIVLQCVAVRCSVLVMHMNESYKCAYAHIWVKCVGHAYERII